jgi:hypothetical protein
MNNKHADGQSLFAITVIVLALAALALSQLTAAAAPEPEALRTSISLNKTSYIVGEPVIVEVSITNAGTTPVLDRWFSYTRGFYLSLSDVNGRRIPMYLEMTEQEQSLTDFVYSIPPGGSVKTSFDLTRGDIVDGSSYFPTLAKPDLIARDRISSYVLKPGQYRLTALQDLRMNQIPGLPPLRLKATQNFEIREPNDLERQALMLFEARPFFAQPNADSDTVVAAANSQGAALLAYSQLSTAYTKTPFAEYALYYSARILHRQGKFAEAASKYQAVRVRYPAFPLLADMLYYETAALTAADKSQDASASATILRDCFRNHLVGPDVPALGEGNRSDELLRKLGLVSSNRQE